MDQQVGELERQIKLWHRDNESSRKLEAIAGIGPLTASALVATVGDATNFRNARQVPAWLGMVPRHEGTGGKAKLGAISKRGDVYVARAHEQHAGRSAAGEVDAIARRSESHRPTTCNMRCMGESPSIVTLLWCAK